MRALFAALIVVAGLALSPPPASAEDPVVIDFRIDAPSVVTVGDRVSYTIVVEVDTGTGITLATAGLPPEVALAGRPDIVRSPLDNEREQVTMTFELAPFAAGEVTVPSLPLRYTQPDGSTGIVETAGSIIQVTSVLPAGGQITPRDLKPQAVVGAPPPTWPIPALAALTTALVLLTIAALVRRRFVRYRVSRALQRIPIFAGPEDIARRSLDRAGAEFSAGGDLIAYYTALGNAVRNYLTERYEFPAFALTTRELEAAMLRQGLNRWQIRVATGLLAQCDAVVYARYRPASERADADLTAAYEIVEMSRPEDRPMLEREEVPVS